MATINDIMNLVNTNKGTSYIVNVITNPDYTSEITRLTNLIIQKENYLQSTLSSMTNREGAFPNQETADKYRALEKPINEELTSLKSQLSTLETSVYDLRPKCGNNLFQLIDQINTQSLNYQSQAKQNESIMKSTDRYYDTTNIYGDTACYSCGLASTTLRQQATSNFNSANNTLIKLNSIKDELKTLYGKCETTQQIIQDKPVESAISIGGGLIPLAILGGLALLSRGK